MHINCTDLLFAKVRAKLLKYPLMSQISPYYNANILVVEYRGPFNNYVDIILLFFDHPPTSMDICYVLNVDKNDKF